MKNETETKLDALTKANTEENRLRWALDWKEKGRKVIGVCCSYIPDEIIYAAGMLPWRVTGSWGASCPLASVYRPTGTDLYYTHALEMLLSGRLDFLDGMVFTNRDDDMRRLYDVWTHVGRTPWTYIMYVPHHDLPLAHIALQDSFQRLFHALEKLSGAKITNQQLWDSINVYNEMRDILGRVYELRKEDKPAISGSEVLGLTTAARVMPMDEFNRKLKALLPLLENRKAPLKSFRPRLMISSDALDHPGYLDIIEKQVGALVAMDDLDTGSRWLWCKVDKAQRDPIVALSSRYLTRPQCPRMVDWDKQIRQTIQWAKEWNIDGVISLTQMNCFPREFREPYFHKELANAGVATLGVKREYYLANQEQLATRFQAFVEMVDAASRV